MRSAAGPRLQARVRKAFDNGFQDFNVRKHTHERVSWPSKAIGCVPVVVLAWVWGGLFAVNMRLKEASLSRYPGWAEYKQRSWWLLPPIL